MKHDNRLLNFLLFLVLLPVMAFAQVRVDSIVMTEQFAGKDKTVYRYEYDSIPRLSGMKVFGYYKGESQLIDRFTYDYTPENRLAHSFNYNQADVMVGKSSFLYDADGNLVEVCDSVRGDGSVWLLKTKKKMEYNSRCQLVSKIEQQYNKGILISTSRIEQQFDSRGRLRQCVESHLESGRMWVLDKIVDKGDRWVETRRYQCDKKGNIIMYRNDDSGDVLRFSYNADNRVIKSKTYRYDKVINAIDFIYDHIGNMVEREFAYEVLHGSNNIQHVYTLHTEYNRDCLYQDLVGVKEGIEVLKPLLSALDSGLPFPFTPVNVPMKQTNDIVELSSGQVLNSKTVLVYYGNGWDAFPWNDYIGTDEGPERYPSVWDEW